MLLLIRVSLGHQFRVGAVVVGNHPGEHRVLTEVVKCSPAVLVYKEQKLLSGDFTLGPIFNIVLLLEFVLGFINNLNGSFVLVLLIVAPDNISQFGEEYPARVFIKEIKEIVLLVFGVQLKGLMEQGESSFENLFKTANVPHLILLFYHLLGMNCKLVLGINPCVLALEHQVII